MSDNYYIGETTGDRYQKVSETGNGRITIQQVPAMSKEEAYQVLSTHPDAKDHVVGEANYRPVWDNSSETITWQNDDAAEIVGPYYSRIINDDPAFMRALKAFWA